MPATARLPVIDVAPLFGGAGAHAVGTEINAACRDLGFFYATGHGIGRDTIDALAEASRRFFALPEARKAAIAMARGVAERSRVEIGVGVTGIAGPGGGTERKPVGMVCIAAARPRLAPSDMRVRTFRFLGGRGLVKSQAAQAALDMVRRWLLELP